MYQVASSNSHTSDDETLAVVGELLARSSSHISFPPVIERGYQQDVRNHYRRRTLITAILALVVFYAMIVLALSSDGVASWEQKVWWVVGGCLPVGVAMLWLYRRPLAVQRQKIKATAVLIFTLSANVMVYSADLETARLAAFAFGLIVITSNVVLSLDFRTAAFTSVASFVITAVFMFARSGYDWHFQALPVLLMTATALLTLAANYRIETTSRYVYLMLLREKLLGRHIRAQNDRLSRISYSDPLTGIANRRAFDEKLATIWADAVRSGEPVGMLMLDIDHFKRFNDTYGHPAGDDCLTKVAGAIAEATRGRSDIAARLGGEEFGIILHNGDVRTARAIARRIHEGVAALRIPHAASPTASFLSVSIGTAEALPIDGGTAEDLVLAADKALYAAKAGGRNRTDNEPRKAA